MLTLQELKKEVVISEFDEKILTAKQLRESVQIIAIEKLGKDTEICVYQNGYVYYRVGRHSTVFPLYLCGDYLYMSGKNVICLSEQFFENKKWSLRLMLEGEDRLNRNQDEKERRWNVSCDVISDKWIVEADLIESILDRLENQEMIGELFQLLTDRQKSIVWKYFFQEETQKQISEELGISNSAVSRILSRAVRRIRKKYPACNLTAGSYLEKERERCMESGRRNRNAW